MRAFIAVDLDNEDYFKDIQKQLPEVKQTFTKAFHITLQFLGEIDEKTVPSIREKINSIKFKPFNIVSDKLGIFPNEKFIRVVWVGFENCKELKRIVEELSDEEFIPHVTLSRVKFVKDKKVYLEQLMKIKAEKKEFEVNRIILFKSELTENGPVYSEL